MRRLIVRNNWTFGSWIALDVVKGILCSSHSYSSKFSGINGKKWMSQNLTLLQGAKYEYYKFWKRPNATFHIIKSKYAWMELPWDITFYVLKKNRKYCSLCKRISRNMNYRRNKVNSGGGTKTGINPHLFYSCLDVMENNSTDSA